MIIIKVQSTSVLTEYGKSVKKALIDLDKPQMWLIEELHKRLPNKYIDRSNLNKILKGKYNSPEIVSAIETIISERT